MKIKHDKEGYVIGMHCTCHCRMLELVVPESVVPGSYKFYECGGCGNDFSVQAVERAVRAKAKFPIPLESGR